MLRKIIQISAIPSTTEHTNGILALCDDGTVWESYATPDENTWDGWHQLPAIPQQEAPNA